MQVGAALAALLRLKATGIAASLKYGNHPHKPGSNGTSLLPAVHDVPHTEAGPPTIEDRREDMWINLEEGNFIYLDHLELLTDHDFQGIEALLNQIYRRRQNPNN